MKNRRDGRLDFLRGLALISILYEHAFVWAAGRQLPVLLEITPVFWGFSCGASIFVFISGRVYGLVYGRMYDRGGWRPVVIRSYRRVAQLYVANLITFLLVWAFLSWPVTRQLVGGELVDSFSRAQQEFGFWGIVPAFARFGIAPVYFDILPLYMVVLACGPLIIVGLTRAPGLTLAVSTSIYLAAQFGYALPVESVGMQPYFLNPVGWQFLFVLGSASARLPFPVTYSKRAVVLASATIVVVAVRFWLLPRLVSSGLVPYSNWWHPFPEWSDRTNLPYYRLFYFGLLCYLACVWMPQAARFWESAPVRMLTTIGQQSLPVFCFGVVFSWTVAPLVATQTGSALDVFLAFLLGTMGSWAVAVISGNRKVQKPTVVPAESGAKIAASVSGGG